MLRSCFLSSFVEFRSAVSEEKSKMSQPIRGQGGHLVFSIRPKNTNLVEDIKILLPVKLHWIPFSGFREVESLRLRCTKKLIIHPTQLTTFFSDACSTNSQLNHSGPSSCTVTTCTPWRGTWPRSWVGGRGRRWSKNTSLTPWGWGTPDSWTESQISVTFRPLIPSWMVHLNQMTRTWYSKLFQFCEL